LPSASVAESVIVFAVSSETVSAAPEATGAVLLGAVTVKVCAGAVAPK
jgi:hypothetical protein